MGYYEKKYFHRILGKKPPIFTKYKIGVSSPFVLWYLILCTIFTFKWHIKDHKTPFYEFTKGFFDGISRFQDNWNTVKRGEFAKIKGEEAPISWIWFFKDFFFSICLIIKFRTCSSCKTTFACKVYKRRIHPARRTDPVLRYYNWCLESQLC